VRQSATEQKAQFSEADRRAGDGGPSQAYEQTFNAQGSSNVRSPQGVHDGTKVTKMRRWRAAPGKNDGQNRYRNSSHCGVDAPLGRQACVRSNRTEPACEHAVSPMRSARACQRVKLHTPIMHTPACMCVRPIGVGGAFTTRFCPLFQHILTLLHVLTMERKKSQRSAEWKFSSRPPNHHGLLLPPPLPRESGARHEPGARRLLSLWGAGRRVRAWRLTSLEVGVRVGSKLGWRPRTEFPKIFHTAGTQAHARIFGHQSRESHRCQWPS
jgi:hypothetical protein